MSDTEPTYEQLRPETSATDATPQEPARHEAACTACRGTTLEPGFVEDSGQGSQGYARWIPGPLERGIFGGAYKLGKERWIVEAWRCTACGHLDLYARSRT